MPKDFDFPTDLDYGKQGENLSYNLAVRHFDKFSNDEDNYPLVFTATPRVKEAAKALVAQSYSGQVDALGRPLFSDTALAKPFLTVMIDEPLPLNHPWLNDTLQGDPHNTATAEYDYLYRAIRFEVKHEGACFGYKRDRHFPTWNVCFELRNPKTGRESGVNRNYDIFCLVVDNRQGQPILVVYDIKERLLRFVKAWEEVASLVGGERDNSEMVLSWLPYYLSDKLPQPKAEIIEPLVTVEDGY